MADSHERYSHSKITTFKQCGFKYKKHYVDGVKINFDTVEAFMGRLVHEALQELYLSLQKGNVLSMDQLLEFYRLSWDGQWNQDVRIVRSGYTADYYRLKGDECLRNYYKRYHPFDQDVTVGLEMSFSFALNESYDMFGIIDRLSRTKDGTFVVHDYKTSDTLPEQEAIDANLQLPLYELGVKNLRLGAEQIRLVYHYLVFDKEFSPGFGMTLPEEERVRKELIADISLIKQVQQAGDFSPNESALCSWCAYKSMCPVFLPQDLFSSQIVDDYVDLCEKRQKIDWDIEEMKEKMIRLAGGSDVKLDGSDHIVYVKAKTQDSFPSKDDPGRKELETLLKKSGKWEDVSILWLSFLNERLKNGKWDNTLVSKMKEFLLKKKSSWVSKPYKKRKW